mmetsp:Transcript_15458/g.42868  ORF Transcript_15458/g.42868 Transcript_15458/m.42868 type:complete len:111 (-) Transcript_15458:1094-1426(-)
MIDDGSNVLFRELPASSGEDVGTMDGDGVDDSVGMSTSCSFEDNEGDAVGEAIEGGIAVRLGTGDEMRVGWYVGIRVSRPELGSGTSGAGSSTSMATGSGVGPSVVGIVG